VDYFRVAVIRPQAAVKANAVYNFRRVQFEVLSEALIM
jgi:hypothetical protein